MSAAKSGDGLPAGAKQGEAERSEPKLLLQAALTGKDQARVVKELVTCLYRNDYSVDDLLRDAAGVKQIAAKSATSAKELVRHWSLVDRAMSASIARVSTGYERFIEGTLHGFCEFDARATIVHANGKMLELIPDCVGRDIFGYFGDASRQIQRDLTAGKRRLYDLELSVDARRHPVLAEFGKIADRGHGGGFAFLIDMRAALEAEERALEAAPFGMLKVDADHRVLYANSHLLGILGLPADQFVGKDSREFLQDPNSYDEATRQFAERRKGRGGEYELSWAKPGGGPATRLRVMSYPSYDKSGRFSGMLASVVSIDHELARNEIAEIVAAETDYRVVFERMLEVIKRLIPFDWADLSLYTPERDFVRSICRAPKDDPDYEVRWFAMPPSLRGWIDQPHPIMADMEAELEANPEGKKLLETDPTMQRALAEGRRAVVAFPLRAGGRIIGALSLQSRNAGQYDASAIATLEKLAVDQALRAIFKGREQSEQAFVGDLLRGISVATSMEKLADVIVTGIVKFYEFQNVSIFKVNELRGYFSLVAQCLGPHAGTAIPKDYTQPLNKGVLGLAYGSKAYVNLGDRHDGSKEAMAFEEVSKETVSELCIPIKLRDRVMWILNLDDRVRNAFSKPEIDLLQSIVDQISASVDHIFQGLVLCEVLRVFPEAVVITSKNGTILGGNEKAQELFAFDKPLKGSPLSAFLSRADLKPALSEEHVPAWTTRVTGQDGRKTPILLSKFLIPEEYDHVILVLKDTTELQWMTNLQVLKAALADATSQVRVPLSLVSTFVQKIARKAHEGDQEILDLAKKTISQLGRIELTYDRVFASYEGNELPREQKVAVDIDQVVDHILAELPEADQATIGWNKGAGAGSVVADPCRLLFALESMLTYLLRSRASSGQITVAASPADKDAIRIVMTGPVDPIKPNGALEEMIEATRNDIALGERLLSRIAGECGGTFARRRVNGSEELSLQLSLSTPTS